MRRNSRQQWVRRALSTFLIFHVLIVAVMPNELFYLRHQLLRSVGPYLNLLGLNVAWKFFAPDPSPAVYLEFDVLRKNAEGHEIHEKSYLPGLSDEFFFRQNYNRRIALKNLLANYPDLMRQLIVPRLVCTQFPGALNIAVSRITVKFPSLTEVEEGVILNDTELNRDFRFLGDEVCLSEPKPKEAK